MLAPSVPPITRHGVDFEKDMPVLPAATLALVAALTAAFIWEVTHGALQSEDSLIAAGALVRGRFLHGQFWLPLSAMFLHAGPGHLVGNCIALYVIGLPTEHAYGGRRFLAIYFAAGFSGALLSMLADPGPSVGASGAIFGLQGAAIVFFHRHRALFFLRDKRVGFVLLIWAIYEMALGFATPYVDNFAHLGGALCGALLALKVRSPLVARLVKQQMTAETCNP
jgi:rhomboid protease GluP